MALIFAGKNSLSALAKRNDKKTLYSRGGTISSCKQTVLLFQNTATRMVTNLLFSDGDYLVHFAAGFRPTHDMKRLVLQLCG